jgi:heme/copper-type cytochrome/quinol oxidase subunit 2
MRVVVDSPDEFKAWMDKQHPFFASHHKQAVATAMK